MMFSATLVVSVLKLFLYANCTVVFEPLTFLSSTANVLWDTPMWPTWYFWDYEETLTIIFFFSFVGY